jgi:hypothetical protein
MDCFIAFAVTVLFMERSAATRQSSESWIAALRSQ